MCVCVYYVFCTPFSSHCPRLALKIFMARNICGTLFHFSSFVLLREGEIDCGNEMNWTETFISISSPIERFSFCVFSDVTGHTPMKFMCLFPRLIVCGYGFHIRSLCNENFIFQCFKAPPELIAFSGSFFHAIWFVLCCLDSLKCVNVTNTHTQHYKL